MRLPDDSEVSDEIWDEVIECMKLRVADKVPVIRTFAVRSLSRFVNDSENGDILDLLLDALPLEQNAVSFPFCCGLNFRCIIICMKYNVLLLYHIILDE